MEETKKCFWCEEETPVSELYNTDIGLLCEHCLRGITSRGEEISVIY